MIYLFLFYRNIWIGNVEHAFELVPTMMIETALEVILIFLVVIFLAPNS